MNSNTTTESCFECEGEGWIEELDYSRVNARTISPPYHRVRCECNPEPGYDGLDYSADDLFTLIR